MNIILIFILYYIHLCLSVFICGKKNIILSSIRETFHRSSNWCFKAHKPKAGLLT